MSFAIEDNIIKAEEIDFDFAKLGGLGNILFDSMKKFGQNVAQIDPETGREDTYKLILRHAIRTAIVLKRQGIKKGDIVMGCSDNHMDACIPIVAALFLGAIPCSMDPSLRSSEMEHMLSHIKPKIIFTILPALQRVRNTCQALKLDPDLVVFGTSDKYTEFQRYLERQHEEDEFTPVISNDPLETAIIFASSGTSGWAKFCCLSHAYFIRQSALIPTNIAPENLDVERRNFEWSRMKNGGAFLCYSSLYWISGGKIFFEGAISGATRVLKKKFDVEEFWDTVQKYKIIITLVIPFILAEMIEYGKPPNVNVETLMKILTGGAALRKHYWKGLKDLLPDTDIVQCYGLTETGLITNFENYNKVHRDYYKNHPECLGFPAKGYWYKVVDLNTGEALGPNQEGELLIKSKYLMNGFVGEPIDTIVNSDGWFMTGDIAYYTEDCAFYVTDRIKDLIRYKNTSVYPCDVEKVLLEHPAVAQAAVFGVLHEIDGDWPAACVVVNSDCDNVKPEEIRKFVDERITDNAKLRGGLKIVRSLPINSSGKVKRFELRKMFLEE